MENNKVLYREKINYLIDWSQRKEFKPLLVLGARQVGKTYLIKELFANQYYPNKYIYINFMDNIDLKEMLNGIKDAATIIGLLEQHYQVKIDNQWLIIFDEIQEIPSLRTSLKSFNENFKNYYHIIASGSYLGNTIMLDREGFPVGQIEKITINPISFIEYLYSTTLPEFVDKFKEIIDSKFTNNIENKINEIYINQLKKFLLIGGLPELVSYSLSDNYNIFELEQKRKAIYDSNISDISKYIDTSKLDKTKAINLYSNIQKSFIKQNNTFILNVLEKDARINNYADVLNLLLMTNLVFKISRLSEVKDKFSIVSDYDYKQKFKLFFNDHGFINLFYKLYGSDFWEIDGTSANVRGSLLENFVVCELSNRVEINQWSRYFTFTVGTNNYEIDLLIEDEDGDIIPIEIKSSTKFSISSLKKYIDVYKPKYAIVLSFKNFNIVEYNNTKIFYIPAYCIGFLNFKFNRLISLI